MIAPRPLMSLVLMDLPLKVSSEMITEPEEEATAVVTVSEAAEAEVVLDLTGGGEAVGGTVVAMLMAVVTGAVDVIPVAKLGTWREIVAVRRVVAEAEAEAMGVVITAAILGTWLETAIASVVAPSVVVEGCAITVGGKDIWLESALVDVEAAVAVVLGDSELGEGRVAVEAAATTVGSKGTLLGNALITRNLDNSR
ncbi:hypothetical protein U1Q18_040086 [Sarracenia purpurea var. burkii]